MQFKQFIRASLLTLTILGVSSANALSSSVTLPGAKVDPGKWGHISFDKLYSGVNYQVTCYIKNEKAVNSLMKGDVLFGMGDYSGNITARFPVTIDGLMASYNTVQQFNQMGSKIQVKHVHKNAYYLAIRNLDYTESLVITDCIADVER